MVDRILNFYLKDKHPGTYHPRTERLRPMDALAFGLNTFQPKPSKQVVTPKKIKLHRAVRNADDNWNVNRNGATHSSGHFGRAGCHWCQTRDQPKTRPQVLHPRQERENPEKGQPRQQSVPAQWVIPMSVRTLLRELSRRPKIGFEVVLDKHRISGFTAIPSPSSGIGQSGGNRFYARIGGKKLWDDFGVYCQEVTRRAGFEAVLWQAGFVAAFNRGGTLPV